MMNTDTTSGRQSRTAKVVGMLLVVTLLFSSQAPVAKAGWYLKPDWSRVQAVTPGARTTVLLYRDLAPPGKRKIKGRFHSATAESVTMLLPDGQTRTVEKGDVRRVLVFRPVGKRYQVGIAAAIGSAIGIPSSVVATADKDYPAAVFFFGMGIFVGIPVTIALLVAPRMGGIYNVPRSQKPPAQSAPNRKY